MGKRMCGERELVGTRRAWHNWRVANPLSAAALVAAKPGQLRKGDLIRSLPWLTYAIYADKNSSYAVVSRLNAPTPTCRH